MRAIVSAFTDDYLVNDTLVHDFIEEKYDVDVPVIDSGLIRRQMCAKKNKTIKNEVFKS